ncbi:hypothetical protein HHI36_008632 [Cryptolaemus montrouzieri]|uniref:Uncharacterized protein n=1 Tax=Cryptolaemus montrouzieri TaxID=559131 RepID=A0ABD2MTC5_9CUCU
MAPERKSHFIETVEGCVESKGRGVPTALVTTTVAQLEFLCKNDGEHDFEIFNPCLFKTLSAPTENCLKTLLKDLRKKFSEATEGILPTICNTVANAKECFTGKIEAQCQNQITRNTIAALYHATMKPCNEIPKTK